MSYVGISDKCYIPEKRIEGVNNMNLQLISVVELQALLGIGRDTAYNLVRKKDFPSVKLGREYRIMVSGLNEWLTKQQKNK
jgi:excisionase family DNA binding protein